MPRKQDPPELVALDRARRQVEDNLAAYQASIRARNKLAREAKAAGHPASEVYRRAGVTQSTFSRQKEKKGATSKPSATR
jgi:hypothetical protein